MNRFLACVNLDREPLPDWSALLQEPHGKPVVEVDTDRSVFITWPIKGITYPSKPFVTDNYFCAGDIELHNRVELMEALQLPDKVISNEELMVRLFMKYELSFAKKLLGEFAFLLWDRKANEVYLIRDQIGMKTLYWHRQGSLIWISSDLHYFKRFIRSSELFHDYFHLFYRTDGMLETEWTPFKGIYQVERASWKKIAGSTTTGDVYWDLTDNCDEIVYRNPRDYEDELLGILKASVGARLTDGKNAVFLSGGMDSTSLFAIASQLHDNKIFPISGVFDRYPECDERTYIFPLLERYNAEPIFESCDEAYLLKDFPDDCPWSYEPYTNSVAFSFLKTLFERAKAEGVTNVLSGYGGDHFLRGNELAIADLMRSGRWLRAYRESHRIAENSRGSTSQILWMHGVSPNFGGGSLRALQMDNVSGYSEQLSKARSFNQKAFIRQFHGIRAHLYADRLAPSEYGLTTCHPFLDRRLIEFMFRMPGYVTWSDGITKHLLRNAMKRNLPAEIIDRSNKSHHMPLTYTGLKMIWHKLFPVLEEGRLLQFGWLSGDEWIEALTSWRQGVEPRLNIFTLVAIELWLYKLELQR